jgi:hypothetical protein
MAYSQSDLESVQAARLALARGERVVSVTVGGITTQYHLTDDARLRVLEADIRGELRTALNRRRFFLVATGKGC